MRKLCDYQALSRLPFTKMHGAGNDFVVLDLRDGGTPSPALCAALADRHTGVGCDLILGVGPALTPGSVASYRIWTADGQSSMQCGNGARCIAAWAERAGLTDDPAFHLDSPAGLIRVETLGDGQFSIRLAVPQFARAAIPLTGFDRDMTHYSLTLPGDETVGFGVVSMGNPHAVIEVADVATAPVARLGPLLQAAPELPDSVNVGFVQICAPDHLRLRVYEFGAGETYACGSGACAAAALLMRQNRIARDVTVSLPGGALRITWPDDRSPIVMTGPAAFVYEGEYPNAPL